MKNITTTLLFLFLGLYQYQAIAQCAPQISYSGVNNLYNLNTPITALNVTNSGGSVTTASSTINFNSPIAQPTGIAVDALGNIYVLESANNQIKKITPNGIITVVITGFNAPRGLCIDQAGVMYVADTGNNAIKKINTNNTVTTIGSGFSSPRGVAVSQNGDVYVADTGNNAIKKISTANVVSTVATGLSIPSGVAIDAAGNLYVAETGNNNIKKISTSNGITVLGFGFQFPEAVVVDSNGLVYVADTGNNTIKKINTDNTVSTMAGSYTAPKGIAVDNNGSVYVSDTSNNSVEKILANNSAFSLTHLSGPIDIEVDASNTIYLLDKNNKLIRKRSNDGTLSIVASGFTGPKKMALDGLGNLYVLDGTSTGSYYSTIKKISPSGSITFIATDIPNGLDIAADPSGRVYVADAYGLRKIDLNGAISQVSTNMGINVVTCNALGNVYVTDQYRINKIIDNEVVNISNGIIDNVGYYFDQIAVDTLGNIYFANYYQLLKLNTNGTISVLASVPYNYNQGIGLDSFGRIYKLDQNANTITRYTTYQISPALPNGLSFNAANGQISGTPTEAAVSTTYTISVANDCGVGSTQITFGVCNSTVSIVLQSADAVVCEGSSKSLRVEAVGCNLTYQWHKDGNPISGAVSSVLNLTNITATNLGSYHCLVSGSSGSVTSNTMSLSLSSSPAISYSPVSSTYITQAPITPMLPTNAGGAIIPSSESIFGFINPNRVATDTAGNIYVIENNYNTKIRKISPNGVVTLFGPTLNIPNGIAVDSSNNVYVIEYNYNGTIQKIDPSGTTSIIASDVFYPRDITVAPDGTIYYLQDGTNFIKKIALDGTITMLGSGLTSPSALALDTSGNIYILDQNGNSLKKINSIGTVTTISGVGFNLIDIDSDTAGNVYVTNGSDIKKVATNNTVTSYNLINSLCYGIDVDSNGTIYTTDLFNSLKKIETSGATFNLISGFTQVESIANDAVGNTYIADASSNIKKIGSNSLNTTNILQSTNVSVVAVDGLNTVYTANTNGNLYKKIGNGSQTLIKTGIGTVKYMVVDDEGTIYLNTELSSVIKKISPSGVVTTLSLGLNSPKGMALDRQGNLYVADSWYNLVKKRTPNGTLTNVGSGFNHPIDVVTDPTGNVYVADSGNNVIKRVALDGSISIVSNNLSTISEISMDGLGNLYVVHSDKRRVSKISSLVNYTVTPSLPAGLTLQPETGIISGTPTILTPFTTYSIRVGNGCGTTTTTIGFEVCSPPVIITQPLSKTACLGSNVTFSLKAKGCNLNYQWYSNGTAIDEANEATLVRNNVTGSDNGTYYCEITTPYGNLLSETVSLEVLTDRIISYPDVISNYPYGVEMTPLNLSITGGSIATHEISVSDLSSGTQYSKEIARGNDGSIYMIGFANTGINKWSPEGILTNIYGGLGYIDAVAVDNQNNLYVSKTYTNEIKKIDANGTVTNIGTGIIYPTGIVVDANGVVYVYSVGDNAIKKIALDGTVTTWASGLDNPSGLAIKEDGSIYVADNNNNAIKIISPEGIVSTAVDNLQNIGDLSFDGRGNLYFTDLYNGNVVKINAQGIITTVTNVTAATGIVSDSDGILYVTSSSSNLVKKIIQGVTYTVTPALPTGMSLDPLTGSISGTPLTFVPTTSYTVSINNGCNTFTTTISFSTCGPIIMDVQPTSQTLCAGGNVILTTVARGCNLGYQWYKNSTPVTGATSSTLELLNVGDSDNGDYLCFVTSSEGNVVSETATVVVNLPPIINYNDLSRGYYLNEPMTPITPTNTGGPLNPNQYITSTYRAVPDTYMIDFAQDATGNFYICSSNAIKKVDTEGTITIVNNTITQTNNMAVDSEGNVWVTQPSSNSILKIDTAGNVTTAISGLDYPYGLSIDASNNIYVTEVYANTLKKISPDGTVLNTWALNGYPYSVAVSPSGTLYVATGFGMLLKIENDTIAEIASSIWNVKLSAGTDGTVYISGYNNIKKINPDGSIEDLNVYLGYDSKVIPGASNTLYEFNNSTSTIDKITGPHLYTISPALPDGMHFDNATGMISGTPTVLTPTTTYTVKTLNNCGENNAQITFAVCTSTLITLQPLPKTVCAGTAVSFEVIGSGSDVTYQWLKNGAAIAGATQNILALQYPTDNDVASYSCLVSGNCGSLTSDAVNLIVVNNNSTAITSQPTNALLCKAVGSTTSFSVATIMPGATYTWQYRNITTTNVNPGWNTLYDSINGVYSGFTSPTLSITKVSNFPINGTQYRVIISGTCGTVISDIVTLNIVGTTVAGKIVSPTSVCLNNSIDFVLFDEVGTSIQWQSAPNATGTFTDIPGANEQVYSLINAQTDSPLSYRAVVFNSCDNTRATTAIKTIKIDLPSLGGTVTGGGYLCPSGSATLNLAGYRGKIQWEYSTDGINFSNAPKAADLQTVPFSTSSISATAASYLVRNLTTSVYFRAKISNGSCTADYSNLVLYTLVSTADAGVVTAQSTTICATSGSTLLSISNPIGSILWEKSTDLITWSSTGKTLTTFEVSNLAVRTSYRAKVSVGGCATVYSNPITINLVPKPLAKSITANITSPTGKTALTAMCTSDTSKVLTIGNASIGTIQWQKSTTSTTTGFLDINGSTTQTYSVTNPSVGANYFRAKFTNSCGVSVFSPAVTVYYTNCAPAKVAESTEKMPFDVVAHPNPYSDTFRLKITTSSGSDVTLSVYDMIGKLLERRVKKSQDIQQENLGQNYPSGVYNIVLSQDDAIKTVRIIKR